MVNLILDLWNEQSSYKMKEQPKEGFEMEFENLQGKTVIKGKIGTSDFVRGFSVRVGRQSYYKGSWEELEQLVTKHFDDHEWGTGSKNGDVLLVNVPSDGFMTSIVEINDSNRHLIEEVTEARAEGEKPVTSRVIRAGYTKQPADGAQIVIYHATVLEQDNDRSTDAEWEIVSVNAYADRQAPMDVETMKRNENHEKGGTLRTYTNEEYAESISYWENHVKVEEK